MAHYFFHIQTDRDLEIDDLGLDFANHAEAIEQARLGARDLLSEMVMQGIDAFNWSIDVADERGTPIARVPLTFAERAAPVDEHPHRRESWLH